MKALILAAGEGKRMLPLTENRPKPMLVLAGKSLIRICLDALKKNGITEATIVVGWESKRLRDFLGDGSAMGMKIRYAVQDQRLGTAHAISMGESTMKDTFLSLNGDVLVTEDMIRSVLDRHRETGLTVMSLAEVEDPRGFGVVETSDGMAKKIWEKPENPPSNSANAGIYCFQEDIFDMIRSTKLSPRGEYEITDTLRDMIETRGVASVQLPGKWFDLGRPWDLLEANAFLMQNLEKRVEGIVEDGATLVGPVVVEKDAHIKSGSYIEGPVMIDRGARIGPNCYIRPSSYIGKKCHIGAATEIKNCIFMDGSNAPHHNYVGDSIIGERCNLGSGTKVANLRFDDGNVHVVSRGKIVDSGRRKLGVIMGDGVKTGVNVSIDPGTVIGGGTYIAPGAYARGYLASETVVR